jgi:hypothetical protein
VGSAPLFSMITNTNYSSSDYNGFGPLAGDTAPFRWDSPPFDVMADYPAPAHTPVLQTREFATLEAYSRATGQDEHSIVVDYSIFENVPMLDARDDSRIQNLYDTDDLDFRLKPRSAAVDSGVVLPNVNDDFAGRAPDLGALEIGAPLPHYGPRD